ncbi:hypothetical protein MRX96_012320 [Rhipicephalus microplus]
MTGADDFRRSRHGNTRARRSDLLVRMQQVPERRMPSPRDSARRRERGERGTPQLLPTAYAALAGFLASHSSLGVVTCPATRASLRPLSRGRERGRKPQQRRGCPDYPRTHTCGHTQRGPRLPSQVSFSRTTVRNLSP